MAWTSIPANYDEVAYWIARTLGHFPRRDTDKDSVIISDVSGMAVRKGVSLCAAAEVLESVWMEADEQNPWLPASGAIVRAMVEKTDFYRMIANRLTGYANQPTLPSDRRPETKPRRRNMTQAEKQDMYGGRQWHEWTGAEQAEMEIYLKSLQAPYRGIFRRMYKIPEEIAA